MIDTRRVFEISGLFYNFEISSTLSFELRSVQSSSLLRIEHRLDIESIEDSSLVYRDTAGNDRRRLDGASGPPPV
jgi:hypothetical protein